MNTHRPRCLQRHQRILLTLNRYRKQKGLKGKSCAVLIRCQITPGVDSMITQRETIVVLQLYCLQHIYIKVCM